MKCTKATIRYAADMMDMSIPNGSAEITCEFEVGAPKVLPFYHDEIQIAAEECVGKSWDEILRLKTERDLAFLRS
jgi:hypothetical protein